MERNGRVARRCGLGLLTVVALLFGVTQLQQRLFRWRAERLVADARTIRVYKSDWADAQRLMTRWGMWGRYEGTCTAAYCAYQITVTDAGTAMLGEHHGLDWMMYDRLQENKRRLWDWLYVPWRGRQWSVNYQFIVRDGIVQEVRTSLSVAASSNLDRETVLGALVVLVHSVNSYRGTMGKNAQLAAHPDYKVGRPQSCTSCLMANISYLPTIGDAELRSFTDFDFSCLTRFRECVVLEQLLPRTRQWDLYAYPWGEKRYEASGEEERKSPCGLPVWTLGRDAAAVFVVDHLEPGKPGGEGTGQIVEVMRSMGRWDGKPDLYAYGPGLEAVRPGVRYLVLRMDMLFSGRNLEFSGSRPPIDADSCSVLEDTSDNREELRKGFAVADARPASELPIFPRWW